jgi:NitT/TauT family transport system substrate-binding protein
LLSAEGLTDVRYVEGDSSVDSSLWIARGELDFDWNYAAIHIPSIEAGVPIRMLAGMHSGCLELIANDAVHSITELRGKRVGVYSFSSSPHVLVTLMAAYVGLDPVKDIQWVTGSEATAMQLFVDGKIDAFLAVPPEPQELRARKIGHTIVSSTVDRLWSQYNSQGPQTTSTDIRWRPSACCGPCSRPPTSACQIQKWLRRSWSMAISPTGLTTRFRP